MIHTTLDLSSEPMLTPELLCGKHEKVCDICIITFSHVVMQWALEHLQCEQVAAIGAVNGDRPIYLADVDGCKIAFYMTFMGASEAAGCIEEANCMIGATHYIMFGACGSLDKKQTEGNIIVPTYAYRDEGLSYHYLKPSEYIELENADKVAAFMEKNKIPYCMGKTWTTDALYRETKNKVERLKADGCIAVEMESSAAQAVCKFRQLQFYNFLLGGDYLEESGTGWNVGILGGKAELDLQVRCFQIALRFARSINS